MGAQARAATEQHRALIAKADALKAKIQAKAQADADAKAKTESTAAATAAKMKADAEKAAAANQARAAAIQAQVDLSRAAEAAAAEKAAEAAAPKAPEYTLTETDSNLTLSVTLPGVTSARTIVLDVDAEFVGLSTETPPLFDLKLNLPFPINPDTAGSKFKKKKSTLVVTMERA